MEEVRIGVFVCHCGTNIGGVINVLGVVDYAKKLPNVVHAENNLYACSEDGLSSVKNKIKDLNLNRVVVASCTPRTHENLFRKACEQAGLNKYLFEFVNIREHCSWIHMQNKEEATKKAKILVKMGVVKAKLLEAQEEITTPIKPVALVIGGGLTGMIATLSIANQGFEVHLIEKEKELGGILRNAHLTASDKTNLNFIEDIIKELRAQSNVKIHASSTVKEVKGYVGNFDVTIDENGKDTILNVGTMIVAIGAKEFEPVGWYEYGKAKNVLTQSEFERKLKEKFETKNIVMIQCVGARIPDRKYCSRFCCINAIKNAISFKEIAKNSNVWILYRDMMTYGIDFENYYKRAMDLGIRFVHYGLDSLPKLIGKDRIETVKVYDDLLKENIDISVDAVVLSTPLVPQDLAKQISKMLKIPLDDDGFFLEAHMKLRPVEFATDGIYLCGSARWPVTIFEGVGQAYAAAAKALALMKKGYVAVEAVTAIVDEDSCIGCGDCVATCPYNAIELKEKNGKSVAFVNIAQCKGCGTCVASCVSGCIQQRGYTDEQLLKMIDALAEY